ncbi:hypothetical protein GGS20DRAFT_527088 [Poronia punctata]|nr:hypothetical protein GGS20DRAFT_527088 [Poronia punctata]
MMEISSLQPPQTGRSRFSKALPAPPPGLDNGPPPPLRKLPLPPSAPLPPKKDSALMTSQSVASLHSTVFSSPGIRGRGFDSPLPVLPIMAEPPRPRVPKAGPIRRKPVAQAPAATPAAPVEPSPEPEEATRVVSINSLISAYSYSPLEPPQSLSHHNDGARETEQSYSREQYGTDYLRPEPTKTSTEVTNEISSDGASEVTSYTIIDSFPPPPSLKGLALPRTPGPRTPTATQTPTQSWDHISDGTTPPAIPAIPAASQTPTSKNSGSPRIRQEIWRRRASARSDRSLTIPELKLSASNGFTVSAPGIRAEPPVPFNPPVKAQAEHQRALPPVPTSPQQQKEEETRQHSASSSASDGPGRLYGEDIQPIQLPEIPSLTEDDEMRSILKFLKGRRRSKNTGDSSDSEGRSRADEGRNIDKPKPPAKDVAPSNQARPPQVEAAPTGQASYQPKSSSITRRPVGAPREADASGPNHPGPVQSRADPQPSSNPPTSGPQIPQSPESATSFRVLPPRTRNRSSDSSHPGAVSRSRAGSRVGSRSGSRSSSQDPSEPRFYGTTRQLYGRYGEQYHAGQAPNITPGPSSAVAAQSQPRRLGPANYDGFPTTRTAASPHISPTDPHFPPGPHIPAPSGRARSRSQAPPPSSGRAPSRGRAPSSSSRAPSMSRPGSRESDARFGPPRIPFDAQNELEFVPMGVMTAQAALGLELFPRMQLSNLRPDRQGVWPAPKLTNEHYNCLAHHRRLIHSANAIYPIACQLCHISDREQRCLCGYCNLRICKSCATLLFQNGRDLEATVARLRAKGMIYEWEESPEGYVSPNR